MEWQDNMLFLDSVVYYIPSASTDESILPVESRFHIHINKEAMRCQK